MMAAITLRAVPISLLPSQPVMFGTLLRFYRPKSTWLKLHKAYAQKTDITYNSHSWDYVSQMYSPISVFNSFSMPTLFNISMSQTPYWLLFYCDGSPPHFKLNKSQCLIA